MTGVQALVRLPLVQRELDKQAGLNTAGYISGYRGSPLGGYDQQLEKNYKLLEESQIKFQPGVNEDLAATALKLFFQAFKEHGSNDVPLGELVGTLKQKLGQSDDIKCLNFVQNLVNAQIIVPSLHEVEQQDILAKYRDLLATVNTDESEVLTQLLSDISAKLNAYATADLEAREILKEGIEARFYELNSVLGVGLPERALTSTFYEDCYLEEGKKGLAVSELGPVYEDLKRLLSITPIFDYNCRLQSIIAQMYLQEFGKDGVCTDPAAFLGKVQDTLNCTGVIWFDYHLSTQFKNCIEMDPDAAALEKLQRSFMDYLIEHVEAGTDVAISDTWLEKINADMPRIFTNRGCSHCFFGHVITDSDDQKGFVLNQSYTGHSNFLSRFLETLDTGAMDKIHDYLRRLSRFGDYMELPGVFGFNANLHAQLADKEVSIKPHNRNYANSELIDLADLSLVYDEETHRVYFSSDTFGKMDVFYFGFLAPIYMPKLYRVLSQAYNQGILSFIITELMTREMIKSDRVTYIPRISLGSIVLWRRSWMVPDAILPDASLDELDYFRTVQAWRETHNLPQTGFIRFTPKIFTDSQKQAAEAGEDATPVAGFDFTKIKPMYVDFRNPILVQALRKALQTPVSSITIQEVLPKLDDNAVSLSGDGYVSELQIEISLEGIKEQA